jgi:hypothetical protein
MFKILRDDFSNLKWTGKVHLLALALLFVGVVTSKFLLSLGMIIGVGSLLMERDFKAYWIEIRANRFFLYLIIIYLLCFISLLWSQNLPYGLHDLRVKTSLVVIPLLLIVKPLKSNQLKNLLLLLFVSSIVISSLINFAVYQYAMSKDAIYDVRQMSLCGSHIRYGIIVAFGIGVCVHYYNALDKYKFTNVVVISWLVFYTYYSQVLAGLISLFIIIFLGGILYLIKKKKEKLVLGIVLFTLIITGFCCYALFVPETHKNISEHSDLVGMEKSWSVRSTYPFDSIDNKNQILKETLVRYLDSKALANDSIGVEKLSEKDIRNIENGYADIHETESGLIARYYGLRYQIHEAKNPNGHSLLQRLSSWSSAWNITKDHWIMGVGVGDVADAFVLQYEKEHSLLREENRLRAHNTYLTTWLSLGIFGFLFLCFFLASYLKYQWHDLNFLGLSFICISLASFCLEDSLETQTGVSFFALFYAFYSIKRKSAITD